MSTNTKITRPTTSADRDRFNRLPVKDRTNVKMAAQAALDSGVSTKEAWAAGFASLAKRSSGVAGKTFQRAVGHRLVDLRAHSASCSCGKKHYKGEDIRDQHAAHKAAKVKVAA